MTAYDISRWFANTIKNKYVGTVAEICLIQSIDGYGRQDSRNIYVFSSAFSLPEDAVMDPLLARDDEPFNKPAKFIYVAVPSESKEFAEIRHLDGRLFCSLRSHDAITLANDINRVARLRSQHSFAFRCNFDGVEHFDNTEP